MLIVLAALAGLLAVMLWFVPLQLRIQFHQHTWDASIQVDVTAPLVKLSEAVNITETVKTAIDHMLTRWRATGEPVKAPLQKTAARFPGRKFCNVVGRPLRYLGLRARCRRMAIDAEVGGTDAMESALLAGVSWTVAGSALGFVGQFVRLDPQVPEIDIRPNFGAPAWRVQADCILRVKLGHATVAGVWLFRRALREKEVITWMRESLRTKGAEENGRPSDSRPDEDGYGEP